MIPVPKFPYNLIPARNSANSPTKLSGVTGMKLIKPSLPAVFTVFLAIFGFLVYIEPGQAATSFFDPHGNFAASTAGCASCHDTHAASGSSLIYAANEKALCYTCHDGSNSNYNIKKEFGEETVGSSVYPSYHPVPNGPQLCTTCHNPHLTNSTTPQLLEVGADKVSTGNAVCGQCHGPGSAIVGGDVYSPFIGTAHDVNMTNPASGTQIKCVRCHQPHGSSIKPLLQNSIISQTGGVYAVTGNNNTVCFACHQDILGSYSGSTVFQETYHGTKTSSTIADVNYPGTAYAPTLCLNCHEPHGKTGAPHYTRVAGNDLCYKCHDDSSVVRPAAYSYQGQTAYQQGAHSSAQAVDSNGISPVGTDFAAWESTTQPTPSAPGVLMDPARQGAMTSLDASWATTSLAASGSTGSLHFSRGYQSRRIHSQ